MCGTVSTLVSGETRKLVLLFFASQLHICVPCLFLVLEVQGREVRGFEKVVQFSSREMFWDFLQGEVGWLFVCLQYWGLSPSPHMC
jgi:hypothetical protein